MSENENKDLLTDEELEKEPEGEGIDWEAEAKKARATAKRYHVSHKQLQELKKAQAEAEKTQKENASKQINKPESQKDSATERLAIKSFLNSEGVPKDDHEFVLEEAKNTGKEVDVLLGYRYIQEELKGRKEARGTQEALPSGSKRSVPSARDSAEYYLEKLQRDEISFGEIPEKLRHEVRKLKEKKAGAANTGSLR